MHVLCVVPVLMMGGCSGADEFTYTLLQGTLPLHVHTYVCAYHVFLVVRPYFCMSSCHIHIRFTALKIGHNIQSASSPPLACNASDDWVIKLVHQVRWSTYDVTTGGRGRREESGSIRRDRASVSMTVLPRHIHTYMA